jgi:curved DNA-binding protein CbpA
VTAADHYATLGVDKGATLDDIKAAWRRASSAAHPDRAGGSDAAQAAVNEAYRVLCDPSLRRQYDNTGHAAPVNIDNEAAQMLGGLLEQALANDHTEDFGGVVAFLQTASAKARAHLIKQREAAAALERRLKKAAKRVKRKTPGPNMVADMLLFKAGQQRKTIDNLNHGLKVLTRAKQMADEYEQQQGDDPLVRLGLTPHYLDGVFKRTGV